MGLLQTADRGGKTAKPDQRLKKEILQSHVENRARRANRCHQDPVPMVHGNHSLADVSRSVSARRPLNTLYELAATVLAQDPLRPRISLAGRSDMVCQ